MSPENLSLLMNCHEINLKLWKNANKWTQFQLSLTELSGFSV